MNIVPTSEIRGIISVPPDKSITHRALMICPLAHGKSTVHNLLDSGDTKSTYRIVKALGGRFNGDFSRLEILPWEFGESSIPLDCGNSGTTARLLSGLLSGEKGLHILYGDESLSKRPMKRVIDPLSKMGARIWAGKQNSSLPIAINGGVLKGCEHSLEIASAQVKSALLLAGIRAEGVTRVAEPQRSRDHTERMLASMGAKIVCEEDSVCVTRSDLEPLNFEVPGDISSAAFFVALACIHPNARLQIEGVGLNDRRIGLLKVLQMMGASIHWSIDNSEPEPSGKIEVSSSELHGIDISPEIFPSMIDELPLLALIGTAVDGVTEIRGAGELRKKESDRISVTVRNFRKLGVEIEEFEDGFSITGPQKITGGVVDSHGDHRMAMLFALAGLVSSEGVEIRSHESVNISYPGFFETIEEVCR